ncbi:MAG: branched-chain amino acid ABC transporter permease [Deltaproteobacteria bacterium]|nr:MAG: branched-chain amino acid ABC transporter permease [Deltaproteobacteria bacterium]
MDTLVYTTIIGLYYGMNIWLVASGLTLIFGMLGILNFAHGSIYMMGAFLGYTCAALCGQNFWVGLIAGPIAVGVIGAVLEFFFLRRVYDLDMTYQLLMTYAFVLILDNLFKIIYGSLYVSVKVPIEGVVPVMNRYVPIYYFFIIFVGILVAILLWFILNKTTFGRHLRAAAYNREMSSAVGIDVPKLFTLIFGIGSAMAALGGAMTAPIQTISSGMGTAIIIMSFIVAVIGGLGSLLGAFVGAIIIGLVNSFGILLLGEMSAALPYLAMIVILLTKPAGLFGVAEE